MPEEDAQPEARSEETDERPGPPNRTPEQPTDEQPSEGTMIPEWDEPEIPERPTPADVQLTETLAPTPHAKPALTVSEQIAHLRSQGVTFNLMSEQDAATYLSQANNYLRTRSYRVLYKRQLEGRRRGEYVNLDFGSLVALSSLDRQAREALLAITIDVEHFAKVKLLRMAEERGEDGYTIVADFMASLTRKQRKATESDLDRRSKGDEYAGALISHYAGDMPLWVLVEVLGFGTFLTLYKFCAGRWGDGVMLQEHYVLKGVKAVRNATAHNHCMLNGLTPDAENAEHETNELITASLNEAGLPRTKSRRAKLQNLRISQVAAVLYMSSVLCTRPDTRRRHAQLLHDLRLRYESLVPQIRPTDFLAAYFEFFWKLVDIWVPFG